MRRCRWGGMAACGKIPFVNSFGMFTQKCDLQMWTKGFLEDETAEIGDVVTVKTAVNRFEKGTLIEVGPYYTHSYGKFVPEIIEIDKQLREIMFGGDK